MDPDRQGRIERIFHDVCELSPEDRPAYLDEACGGDAELRAEVESLLEYDKRADDVLPSAGGTATRVTRTTASVEQPIAESERIGPYRVLRKIGEGGMGIVFEARQEAPVRRTVALKLIKWGMDTKQVVARFESERQALALMDHANIARVFDAGATEQGRPYFAMEYVKGVPITEYCDTHRLTTRERLEFLMQVCDGAQHAHQKGIIHRDIKPSNVLVGLQGDKAVPKIIDFGVAKATAQRLTEKTIFTEYGQLIGTPEYMSPEQAEMTALDIDTRTDVYSLGVLLYELLVGALPFDPEELRQAGFDEIRRKIREDEPSKPSTRISTLGDEASSTAAERRRTEVPALRRQLKGDLDWITMKSLEKDRTRRYQSASDLAADIKRHISHEPVMASPPSTAYRLAKFVRRHRLGVAAASAVTLTLVAGVVGTTIGLVRAHRAEAQALQEADTSERVATFLADMLGEVDPEGMGWALTAALRERARKAAEGRGASEVELTAILASFDESMRGINATDAGLQLLDEQILVRAAATIESEFADTPLIAAKLEHTLGITYRRLGLYEQANAHGRRAVEIRAQDVGEEHPDTLQAMYHLANTDFNRGRYEEAESLFRETLEVQRRVLGEEHPDTLNSMRDLATTHSTQGRYEEAEELHRETLRIQTRIRGEGHLDTLGTMNDLAVTYQRQGHFDEAEGLYRKVFETSRRVLGEEHRLTLTSMNNLATIYKSTGRYEETEKLHRETLEIRRRVLGEEHPETLGSMNNLAVTFRAQGRYDEAEKLDLKVLEIRRRVLGEEHPETLQSMNNLADTYGRQGRYDDKEELGRKVYEIRRRVLGEEHPHTLGSMHDLADTYWLRGRYEEAEEGYREVFELRRRVLGEEHPYTLWSLSNVVLAKASQGRYAEAEELSREVLEIRRRVLGEEHPDTLVSMNRLALAKQSQGRYGEAKELFREVLEIRRRVLGEEHPETLRSMLNVANTYSSGGRYEEAETLFRKILEVRRRVLGEEHPDTLHSINNLAITYLNQDRYEETGQLFREVLAIRGRVLGEEHPDTIASMNNLAVMHVQQGHYDDAEELHEKTLEIRRRVLGEEHPDTLVSLSSLGDVYRKTGRYQEAASLLEKALQSRIKVLGENHPALRYSYYNLGCLAAAQGHDATALELLGKAVERGYADREILEDTDLDTLRADPEFQTIVAQVKKRIEE